MKVFVTGATGFVGREVMKELHCTGHASRILVRNPNSKSGHNLAGSKSIETHKGDVTNADSLAHALDGIDAVIHLVGVISEAGDSTFEKIHVEGTRNMVEATKTQGVSRFVQMSALGTRPNAVSRYHQTKWAAEEIVRKSGLAWTIFRPSLIYGPDDEFVNLFAKISRLSPIVPLLGAPHVLFQPVSVHQVARAFVASLTEPAAQKKTFDVAGPDRLTLSQIIDAMLKATGRHRFKLPIPRAVSTIQAASLEFLYGKLLRR